MGRDAPQVGMVELDTLSAKAALRAAAKDIYSDGSSVALNDLAISEVVDTLAFSLIVNAMLIARYGCPILKITDREGKT